ncbi:alpha-ketoglutarate-dependent dioxygenase AlkB family protein [Hoeflea alexandrii]|uniref:Alpha-ketoglutarate-dependent dioxygenase AlkB n=1 Tax=Hoeflea alexandrii TaxID=288436 RepID=A0ABT1CRK4_9HYPH|nr:alpha-ketoglutarate-dependent dioxygenase AlkB [Hoeflea alexandrii]MCO6408834.1 alpha-ketoglutarate-dependent dioxygenase AlkB [Hoeflea alexandrii]MCY0151479.1 alpha-ketoglutarate-dependent dioxygenase AlkB [Hoeflea alexandrii]
MLVLPNGVRHIPGHLDRDEQQSLLEDIRAVVGQAPLYRPEMPRSGKPFSVRMTNCGDLGWVADKASYRYQDRHPVTGAPWPPIPERLLKLWDDLTGYPGPPQACLVNFYHTSARMGLHQDRDESDFSAPVLSISLGDACLFRIGGTERRQPTRSFRLESGDVVILGGESRLAFHGVDRIYPMTSTLLKDGGRINLTLRRVTAS